MRCSYQSFYYGNLRLYQLCFLLNAPESQNILGLNNGFLRHLTHCLVLTEAWESFATVYRTRIHTKLWLPWVHGDSCNKPCTGTATVRFVRNHFCFSWNLTKGSESARPYKFQTPPPSHLWKIAKRQFTEENKSTYCTSPVQQTLHRAGEPRSACRIPGAPRLVLNSRMSEVFAPSRFVHRPMQRKFLRSCVVRCHTSCAT